MREYLTGAAQWSRLKQAKTGKVKKMRCAPPMQFANHYLARVDKWRHPVLRAIVETPTLRADGSLLTAEGYDPASGFLLDTNGIRSEERRVGKERRARR